jgi:hypothetical protein
MFSQPRCRTLTKNRRDDAWNEGTNGYRFTFSERPRGIPPSAYARSRSVIMSQVGVPRLALLPSYRFVLGAVLSREERVEGPSRAPPCGWVPSVGKGLPLSEGVRALKCPPWVKSRHVQRTHACPLSAKSGHKSTAIRSHQCSTRWRPWSSWTEGSIWNRAQE